MCLLFKGATTILELAQNASGHFSDVSRRRARSRMRNDASTGKSLASVCLPLEMHSPFFRFFCICHLNWTNLMPVLYSCADHGWKIVDLFVLRNVMWGEIKASGKPSVPVMGCVLSKAFCAHSERPNP